ncbi:hypothetical protein NC651_000030 [Populus alba x Populus x berolinensis]|nr:hypothetical protein NC651_000030 [Populus alba x Populus x berolinensis]
MPSEIMDSQGLPSSSFFSEDVSFPERQVGFWKSDTMPDQHGCTFLIGILRTDLTVSHALDAVSLSSTNPLYGHSVYDTIAFSFRREEEPFESLERN